MLFGSGSNYIFCDNSRWNEARHIKVFVYGHILSRTFNLFESKVTRMGRVLVTRIVTTIILSKRWAYDRTLKAFPAQSLNVPYRHYQRLPL